MRVELPGSAPQNGPAIPVAGDQSVVHANNPARRASTKYERFIASSTSWRVAAPTLGLTAALLCWSLLYRLPEGSRLLKVNARSRAMAGGPVSTSAATTPAEVAALRAEALHVSQTLVSQRKEILPLLTHLEAAARQSGWRCERTIKPAQPSPSGLTNLTLHPVVLRLTPETEQTAGYYPRLLEWLNSIAALDRRAEAVSVHVQAAGAGITSAEIKIHFFSAMAHEETAAK